MTTGGLNEIAGCRARYTFSDSFITCARGRNENAEGGAHGSPGPWEIYAQHAAWRCLETPGSVRTRPEHRHARRLDRAQPDHRDGVLSQPRPRQWCEAPGDFRDHHPSRVLFWVG